MSPRQLTILLTVPQGLWKMKWNQTGFYTKGRPLVKSNLICPSDKLSWQTDCPVLHVNIQKTWCRPLSKSECFPKTINSLWHNDSIWWHTSGSTLPQVMVCCLMELSHYFNQCELIFCVFQNYTFKITATFPGSIELRCQSQIYWTYTWSTRNLKIT